MGGAARAATSNVSRTRAEAPFDFAPSALRSGRTEFSGAVSWALRKDPAAANVEANAILARDLRHLRLAVRHSPVASTIRVSPFSSASPSRPFNWVALSSQYAPAFADKDHPGRCRCGSMSGPQNFDWVHA